MSARECPAPAHGPAPARTSSAELELALGACPSDGGGTGCTRRCTSVCFPGATTDMSRPPRTPPSEPRVEYVASLRLPSTIALVFRCSGAQPVCRRSDDANGLSKPAPRPARCLQVPTARRGHWEKLRVELTGLLENSSKPSSGVAGSQSSWPISRLCDVCASWLPLPRPRCGAQHVAASGGRRHHRTFLKPEP
jgi:hypothetical protein